MTSKERLMTILKGSIPDRSGLKLWAATPGQAMLHPMYQPVYDLAMEKTDLMVGSGSAFDLHYGRRGGDIQEREEIETASPDWTEEITRVHTPEGDLQSIFTKSTCGLPGYQKEHLLKSPEDIHTLRSVPYEAFDVSTDGFLKMEDEVGDRGVVLFGLDHAMYGLQRLIGSENFAMWSLSHRELLLETIGIYSERILDHAKATFASGLRPVFAWVGPELCIPPLMSPRDFDEFVYPFDKKLCDLIHDGGGHVWVHSHGKMGPVLERFVEMGVDVLNPIEPPPMGDITLAEAFQRVGNRMGLEGNIETHDLMTATTERIEGLVREAMDAGRGKRFILCPSSGYMEWPTPTPQHIENLMTFIRVGAEG